MSQFTSFAFRREASATFCPPVNSLYRVDITHQSGRTYILSASTLVEGGPQTDTCIMNGVDESQCLVEQPLPERTLSDTEAASIRTAFGEVEFFLVQSACESIVEPCLINTFTWDDFTVSHPICGTVAFDAEGLIGELEALTGSAR